MALLLVADPETGAHVEMDDALLERTMGFDDRPDDYATWVEWRLKSTGQLVKRDCHVTLRPVVSETAVGGVG